MPYHQPGFIPSKREARAIKHSWGLGGGGGGGGGAVNPHNFFYTFPIAENTSLTSVGRLFGYLCQLSSCMLGGRKYETQLLFFLTYNNKILIYLYNTCIYIYFFED